MYGTEKVAQSPAELTIKKFDKVYFSSNKVKELERQGIPYPMDFFLAIEARPDGIRFVGSCGGGDDHWLG